MARLSALLKLFGKKDTYKTFGLPAEKHQSIVRVLMTMQKTKQASRRYCQDATATPVQRNAAQGRNTPE
jgi:hypothetical protein